MSLTLIEPALVHRISVGAWPVEVWVSASHKALRDMFETRDRLLPAPSATNIGLTLCHADLHQVLVWLPHPASTTGTLGTVVHECLHVVQFIRELCNHDDPLGDETEAYLLADIVCQVLTALHPKGMRIRSARHGTRPLAAGIAHE